MALKSLIEQVKVDRAGKSHNCQANSKHRIKKGETRLKVKTGRSWRHYCINCAEKIIMRDIEKLTTLKLLIPPPE